MWDSHKGSPSYLEWMRGKLFKAVNNATLGKCYTDCKDVSRSLRSKGPFAKSFATVIKARGGPHVEGGREKQRAKCP